MLHTWLTHTFTRPDYKPPIKDMFLALIIGITILLTAFLLLVFNNLAHPVSVFDPYMF